MEKTMQIGNVTVTIIRPELTEQERTQVEEEIKRALVFFNERK
ncbi:MAG: hypothetical protein ACI4IK_01445 [Eubacterium sp.]